MESYTIIEEKNKTLDFSKARPKDLPITIPPLASNKVEIKIAALQNVTSRQNLDIICEHSVTTKGSLKKTNSLNNNSRHLKNLRSLLSSNTN